MSFFTESEDSLKNDAVLAGCDAAGLADAASDFTLTPVPAVFDDAVLDAAAVLAVDETAVLEAAAVLAVDETAVLEAAAVLDGVAAGFFADDALFAAAGDFCVFTAAEDFTAALFAAGFFAAEAVFFSGSLLFKFCFVLII